MSDSPAPPDPGPAMVRPGGHSPRQLLTAVSGSLVMSLAGLGIGFASSVVLARVLAPAAFGAYSYAFSLVTLLALLPQMGIPTLLIRETARAEAEQAWPRMRGLWRWATRSILATSLATAVVVAVVIFLDGSVAGAKEKALLIRLLLSPLISLATARSAALIGLHKVVLAQLPDTVVRPLLLMAFVMAAWWMGGSLDAGRAMLLHAAAAALALCLGVTLLMRARPATMRDASPDMTNASAWRRATWTLGLVSGLQIFSGELGVVLVGMLRSEAETGAYKVAVTAAALGRIGYGAIAVALGPAIARLYSRGERDQVQKVLGAAAWGSTLVTLPFLVVVLAGGRPLVAFLYGDAYSDATAPLVILALAQALTSYFGLAATTLGMTGHERDCVKWLLLSSAVNCAISIAFVPAYGIVAGAIAQLLATAVWNAGFWWTVRVHTGLDTRFRASRALGAGQILRLLREKT